MWNIEFIILSIFVTCLAVFLVFLGRYRYRYAINPLFIFAVFDIGFLTILSAIVAKSISGGQDLGLSEVLYLSVLYILGFFLIFLPQRLNLPRQVFNSLVKFCPKNSSLLGFGGVNQLCLVLVAIFLFILLAYVSGAGLLWFTDSRQAYQSFRAGSGPIYVMVQWALLISLMYYIWCRKPRLAALAWAVCLYSLAAYFTGSKVNILAGAMLAGFYYYFFIRKVPAVLIILAPIVGLGFFLILLVLQGSYSDIYSTMSYFRDYALTTGQFLVRFDEFGYQWGYGMLSDLWFYIPRAIYPDKPFEYGIALIHKVLFPGAAAQGHTPGVLPWALAYLDFGAVGVFFSGLVNGFIRRGAYESFLANKTNILAFILMVQLSLLPVFAYATLPMIIVIGILTAIYMQKKIVFVSSAR